MNRIFSKPFIAAALVVLPLSSFAHHNPAVQNVFFHDLETALPSSQPAPVARIGSVTEVTWAGLAWEVANVSNTHVPLVIEFYSANPQDCTRSNPTGQDECLPQVAQTLRSAANYAGRVKFVRFNVQNQPSVMLGPDVRVLPSHIFVGEYTDSSHYTAIRVWGLLDKKGFEQAIQETFQIAP